MLATVIFLWEAKAVFYRFTRCFFFVIDCQGELSGEKLSFGLFLLQDCFLGVVCHGCVYLLRNTQGGQDYHDPLDHHDDPLDHHDHHHGYQGVHSVDKYMEVLYSLSAGAQVKIIGRKIFKRGEM